MGKKGKGTGSFGESRTAAHRAPAGEAAGSLCAGEQRCGQLGAAPSGGGARRCHAARCLLARAR